jgi:fatty acid desaturase
MLTGIIATINELSVPLFGVPFTVITMATGGALISFAYGVKVKPRKKMYMLAGANAFVATVLVAVLPAAMGWAWSSPKIEPALAACFAIAARWVIPPLIEMVPEIIRKIFKLPPKVKESEDEST